MDENSLDDSHYIYKKPIRELIELGNSPIIRFHWGYRSDDNKWDDYKIPLKNIAGESYHQLKNAIVNPEYSSTDQNKWTLEDKEKYRIAEEYQSLSFKKRKIFIYEKLKDKGPFLWEGGPFQNGCNHLKSLWREYGFSSWPKLWATIPFPAPFPIPVNVQAFNPETDTLLTSSLSRQYFAHAAGRLAKLIAQIRKNNNLFRENKMKNIIRLGDLTSHGGKVISSSSTLIINGKKATLLYDIVSCPLHGDNQIIESSSHYNENGKGIVFDGCKTQCGAIVYSTCNDMEI